MESPGGNGSSYGGWSSESPAGGWRAPGHSPRPYSDGESLSSRSGGESPSGTIRPAAPARDDALTRAGQLLAETGQRLKDGEDDIARNAPLLRTVRAARVTLEDVFGDGKDGFAAAAAAHLSPERMASYLAKTSDVADALANALSDPREARALRSSADQLRDAQAEIAARTHGRHGQDR